MSKNSKKVKFMAGVGILTALVVVLGLISNYVPIGTVSINLALIPIVVGACVYGPLAGLFLGVVDGVMCLTAPSTLASFFPFNPFMTIVLCLVKTGVAGLVAGLLYKVIYKKNSLIGAFVSSLATPIVNTGIFLLGVICFFMPLYKEWAGGSNAYVFLITSTLTINFLIEFLVSAFLSPAVHRIISYVSKDDSIRKFKDDTNSKEAETL